jgi:hypothetical protein
MNCDKITRMLKLAAYCGDGVLRLAIAPGAEGTFAASIVPEAGGVLFEASGSTADGAVEALDEAVCVAASTMATELESKASAIRDLLK